MLGSFDRAVPAGVERILEKASLEGARMVIWDADARAEESWGWVARRPVPLLSLAYRWGGTRGSTVQCAECLVLRHQDFSEGHGAGLRRGKHGQRRY